MGLFSSKPKMSVRDWCENFYSNAIFANIRNVDPWQVFCDLAYEQIVQADNSFSQVQSSIFASQLLALRLEVTGIAWFIHENENFSPLHNELTRKYLQLHDYGELWDIMAIYNEAVARSAAGGIDTSSRQGSAKIASINLKRIEHFKKWSGSVSEPKDAARAANRIECQTGWKTGRTPVYLSFALTNQLDCDVNQEAREVVLSLINGFFDGASQELRSVKIVA